MSPSAGFTRIQHDSLRGRDLWISKLNGREAHDRSAEVINICPIFPSFALVYFPVLTFEFSHGRVRENSCRVVKVWVLENHRVHV